MFDGDGPGVRQARLRPASLRPPDGAARVVEQDLLREGHVDGTVAQAHEVGDAPHRTGGVRQRAWWRTRLVSSKITPDVRSLEPLAELALTVLD
ncbi:hypothetical protein AB0B06_30440 [Streptomyces sp. NPDC044989]|uniref:hypothetical protein n=1 Tax=unclassified Streptomyces TaxID=2593676 RepID=UPI0034020FA4